MLDTFIELGFFTTKAIIIVALILILIAGIIALLARGKEKTNGKISIKNLNKSYEEVTESLLEQILPKLDFKKHLKIKKKHDKQIASTSRHNIFVIDFQGDIKASAVSSLREEITA